MGSEFEILFEQMPDATLILDQEGRIFLANRAMETLTGYPPEELVGQELDALMTGPPVGQGSSGAQDQGRDRWILKKDGTQIPADLHLTSIPWRGSTAILATMHDSAELSREPQTRQYYERILNTMNLEIATFDPQGNYEFLNRHALEAEADRASIIGHGDEHLSHMHGWPLSVAENRRAWMQEAFSKKEPVEFEEVLPSAGWPRNYYRRFVPVLGPDGSVERLVGIGLDITKRKIAEDGLMFLATHDKLTGLPNRVHLMDHMRNVVSDAAEGNHELALAFFDLDGFKFVNDAMGHQMGDDLLVEVGGRLALAAGEEHFVSRHGGDEFVLVVESKNSNGRLGDLIQEVHDIFAEPFRLNGRIFQITACSGIAVYPRDAGDAEGLLRCADLALYHAKSRGKNQCHFFTADLQKRAVRRMSVEQELRRALDRRDFHAVFQPIEDLRSGRIYGMESLIRWSYAMPDEFVPIAEETGLVRGITDFMLAASSEVSAAWQKIQPGVRINVNVASGEFRMPAFFQRVLDIVKAYPIDPPLLVLEITETSLLEGGPETREILEAIQGHGIAIAVDDFGAGYSSLRYLAEFPIDTLKIDRYFVKDVEDTPRHREICRGIIALAHNLGIRVVAEGVERKSQYEIMGELGCDAVQGWYVARPMAAPEAAAFLRARGNHHQLPHEPLFRPS